MTRYQVTAFREDDLIFEVEAESAAEAIDKVSKGHGDFIESYPGQIRFEGAVEIE